MNKKALTETDIRTKFITPAILGANGDKWDQSQMREEVYFTKGRVIVRGKTVKRGEAKKADYLLFYKPNIPLAVIEAKDNNHSVGAGMPQALEYAEILDAPFAFSSNGDAFLEHDRTVATGTVSLPSRTVGSLLLRERLERKAATGQHPGLLRRRLREVAALLSAHRH
jgi:type I restriction enzyme R subunit